MTPSVVCLVINAGVDEMKTSFELPVGYSEIFRVDLQNDKKKALLVNGLSLLLMVPMFIIGAFIAPIKSLFDFGNGFCAYFLKWGVVLVGMIVYVVLHELVHGVFIKRFSGKKAHYGFTGLYAFAGSDAYFNKRDYIIIALAPVVMWGVVLLVLNLVLPVQWFWCVYLIQIFNISGAAGDFYVTYKFSQMPADILVRDVGVAMNVYSREASK